MKAVQQSGRVVFWFSPAPIVAFAALIAAGQAAAQVYPPYDPYDYPAPPAYGYPGPPPHRGPREEFVPMEPDDPIEMGDPRDYGPRVSPYVDDEVPPWLGRRASPSSRGGAAARFRRALEYREVPRATRLQLKELAPARARPAPRAPASTHLSNSPPQAIAPPRSATAPASGQNAAAPATPARTVVAPPSDASTLPAPVKPSAARVNAPDPSALVAPKPSAPAAVKNEASGKSNLDR